MKNLIENANFDKIVLTSIAVSHLNPALKLSTYSSIISLSFSTSNIFLLTAK
jgi:hypothetical protein